MPQEIAFLEFVFLEIVVFEFVLLVCLAQVCVHARIRLINTCNMLSHEHNAAQATTYFSYFAILRLYAIAVAQSG
jgi:hypothetical protein